MRVRIINFGTRWRYVGNSKPRSLYSQKEARPYLLNMRLDVVIHDKYYTTFFFCDNWPIAVRVVNEMVTAGCAVGRVVMRNWHGNPVEKR